MAKAPGVVLGAVMGALLGSVGAAMAPKGKKMLADVKGHQKEWAEKAKNISENVYNEMKNHWGHEESEVDLSKFVTGAVVGMLVGASSALLLTPKTGKQMRSKISEHYQTATDKAQDILEAINKSPKVKQVKKAIGDEIAHVKQSSLAVVKKTRPSAKAVKKTVKAHKKPN